jgi:transposase
VVWIGIDAHKRSLAVSAVDGLGRELARGEFANEAEGHERLSRWAERLGAEERCFGLEGSGWLAHGLARFLVERGEDVRDVRGGLTERERRRLRGAGKSDPRDALAIARVTAREQLPPVRLGAASRELKLLCDYRWQLLCERTRAANRLHVDLVSLQPGYERRAPALTSASHLEQVERLLAGDGSVQADVARRRLERIRALDAEVKEITREIRAKVRATGTGLVALVGVSDLIAARIVGEVGDVGRIETKDRFARLNGTAPIPASSGQTHRHRLDKGGNRRLNHALHMMALTQARMDPRARAYVDRKRAEGKTYRDAIRALKRHLSDVVYQQLRADARKAMASALT